MKHCGKGRKCCLPAFSPFCIMFSKGSLLIVNSGLCGKELNPLKYIVSKGENAGNQHFHLFLQCFVSHQGQILSFKACLKCL